MNTEPDDESLLIFPSLSDHLASHDHVKISKHNPSEIFVKYKKDRKDLNLPRLIQCHLPPSPHPHPSPLSPFPRPTKSDNVQKASSLNRTASDMKN